MKRVDDQQPATPPSRSSLSMTIQHYLDDPFFADKAEFPIMFPPAYWQFIADALATRSESAPIWKPVSANDATRGVAWIDEQATHIGKIEGGQRYLMQLPEAPK